MAFDARAAMTLQPGEHMIVDEAPGLRVVATAARRTWTYRYKSPIDGNMRQIALGPAMSPSAVRMVIDDYLREHIAHRRKAKGQAEVRRLFDRGLGEVAGMQAESVTRSVAYGLLSDMADRLLSLSSSARSLVRRGIWRWTPAASQTTRRTGGCWSCAAGYSQRARSSAGSAWGPAKCAIW